MALKATRLFHFTFAMFYPCIDWHAVKSSPTEHFIFEITISKMKCSVGRGKIFLY